NALCACHRLAVPWSAMDQAATSVASGTDAAPRILVVDDDRRTAMLVRAYLLRDGYQVSTAHDGLEALDAVERERPDLVVLDLMLPEVDGLEVTRRLRAASDVPILMLTARSSVADRVRGLSQGADDYLPKPFAPSEMVARVQSILRRAPSPRRERVLRFKDVVVDLGRREVRRQDAAVVLSHVEFQLLAALLEADGRVLARDHRLDA